MFARFILLFGGGSSSASGSTPPDGGTPISNGALIALIEDI